VVERPGGQEDTPKSLEGRSRAMGCQRLDPRWTGERGKLYVSPRPEPELHLGRDVLVPDMAGWRRERVPEMPDTVGFTLPPDWACEVLSPSTHVGAVEVRAEPFEALALELGTLWLPEAAFACSPHSLEATCQVGLQWVTCSVR
jgi:hypothetical protein